MATAQGMSGIDTRAMVAELSGLLPLWVDKVYQFDSRTLAIRLNGESKAHHQFIVEAGRRAHLVRALPEPPKIPPAFSMLLRKHITGGKVLGIRQHGLERIIIFDIGKGEKVFRLIIELFDNGNVILADGNYDIIQPLYRHRFRDREIVPKAPYVLSPSDPTASEENLAAALKSDGRDLVRALAIGCMLGGTWAEYLCRKAGLGKAVPAASADVPALYRELRALLDAAERDRHPVVTTTCCEPVAPASGDGMQYPTFSGALEAFFPLAAPEKKRAGAARRTLSKEERIRKFQNTALKKFDEKIAQAEAAATAIYENYAFVSDVIATLAAAAEKIPWQEMERHLCGTRPDLAGKILAYHPEEASVDIGIGSVVRIHVHEGVEQNAGRYHELVKKFKKKRAGARAAMQAAPAAKPPGPRREIVPAKKLWYHRFRWFVTSDGVVVLGGRDASQNEELVRKYMTGGDLFVHADVHGASVVIVKGKTGQMDQVAQFAASYSGAWKSGHVTADVFSALPSQVSKTPESGEYVSRGSFIVRGERTWYRNVPLAVAIGLVLEPHAAVIGGPPSAVREKTKTSVGLRPGKFEPNDVAKKVLRILRQHLPDADVRALKSVLNTEQVAAFVPPGGSDTGDGDEG